MSVCVYVDILKHSCTLTQDSCNTATDKSCPDYSQRSQCFALNTIVNTRRTLKRSCSMCCQKTLATGMLGILWAKWQKRRETCNRRRSATLMAPKAQVGLLCYGPAQSLSLHEFMDHFISQVMCLMDMRDSNPVQLLSAAHRATSAPKQSNWQRPQVLCCLLGCVSGGICCFPRGSVL